MATRPEEMTDSSADTRRIRHDIDRTQREMSRTIDEIGVRFSPDYIIQRTKASARRAGVNTSRSLIDKVKSNPIPAAMVGVGLYLMMRNHEDESHYDGYEMTYGLDDTHPGHDTRERMSEAVDAAKDRVSSALGSVRGQASHAASNASHMASRARMSSRNVLNDSPLIAGIAAIALGAIVGAILPETEREDRLFGEKRDELVSRGKDLAREGMDKAKDVAGSAMSAAKDAATTAVKDASPKSDVERDFTTGSDLHV